jgi:hypothetical protein
MAEFLNRRPHLERLSRMFSEIQRESVGLVIASGKPGVGKSALLRQAATAQHPRYCYVFCDRALISRGLPGGVPLPEMLQRSLTDIATATGFPTFEGFCSEKRWLKMMGKGVEAVGAIVAKSVLPELASEFALETYGQIRTALGNRAGRSPSVATPDDQRLMYALAVLRTTDAIVHVDHAQCLSEAELDTLLALHDQTGSPLFLEYTVDAPFTEETVPVRLQGRNALVLTVQQLENQYVDRLFASLPERFASALRREFVKSGDLRLFDQAMSIRSHERGILEVFDITEENLVRMTQHALETLGYLDLNLLLAIAAHAGPVDRALLAEFANDVSDSGAVSCALDIDDAIERLEDKLLVIPTSTDVMCQTRVGKVVGLDSRFAAASLVFRKLWRDFYREVPKRQVFVSDEDRCRQLLHQCAQLNDLVGIGRTLEEVGQKGIVSKNPRSIVTYLKNVVEKLQFQGEKQAIGRVALSQALFFYEAGWFDEALACFSLIDERSPRKRYFVAELYCATGHQTQGIRLVDSYLSELDPLDSADVDAELCLRLIRLHGLRSSNRLDESREYYLSTINDSRFATLAGFPTLLRFADLCLYKDEDLHDCIELLRRAARAALVLKQSVVFASACISLVQQLGYTEAFDETERLLDEAEMVSNGVWLQRPMHLNNRAVLAMYRGTMHPQELDLLAQALVLSYDPLDRILIHTNIVAWHGMVGNLEQASKAAAALRRAIADTSLDTEIRRIALYNLEQLDRCYGNTDDADRTFAEWSALDSGIDEAYWDFRRKKRAAAPDAIRRYHMTFHPVYLAHWHTGLVPLQAVVDQE